MVVGVLRMTFSLPGNESLKGKRKVSRRILDRARHRFNAAVAEVDDMDEHRRLVLGAAVVSNDHGHANTMLDKLASYMAQASEAVEMERRFELLPMGELEHSDWSGA